MCPLSQHYFVISTNYTVAWQLYCLFVAFISIPHKLAVLHVNFSIIDQWSFWSLCGEVLVHFLSSLTIFHCHAVPVSHTLAVLISLHKKGGVVSCEEEATSLMLSQPLCPWPAQLHLHHYIQYCLVTVITCCHCTVHIATFTIPKCKFRFPGLWHQISWLSEWLTD